MLVRFARTEVSTRERPIGTSKAGILKAPSGVNIAKLCVPQEKSSLNISDQIVSHLDLLSSNKVQNRFICSRTKVENLFR